MDRMDKSNKNRTDLLAAGRKKLQQFRQKKDGKGGKSSSKSNKSECDASKVAVTSEQVVGRELPEHNAGDVVDSSELHSREDSGTVANDFGTIEQSPKVGAIGSSATVSIPKLLLEDSGVSDAPLDPDVDNKHDDIIVLREDGDNSEVHNGDQHAHLETPEVIISEEKIVNIDMTSHAELLSQGERHILEEQVTDVGTMQDFGSSVPRQGYASSEMGTKRVVTNDRKEEVNKATSPAAKLAEPDAGSSSTIMTSYANEAREMGGLASVSGQPAPEYEGFTAITAQVPGDQINLASGSSNEIDRVDGNDEKEEGEGSSSFDASTGSPGSRRLTLSSGSDSIHQSQLAEMIWKLVEGELKFLLESKEAQIETLPNSWGFSAPQSQIFDFCERIKDHLYLTCFAEHTSQLQLAEVTKFEMLLQERVKQLVEELSVANASLGEVQRQNEFLSEDLTQCRSQLLEAVSGREGLKKQLHDSKAELEVLFSRVNDLQNKLEMSQGNLAAVSSELADCRNFSAALLTENEDLSGRLSLLTEEKMKLAEKEEYFVQEHDKMATELAHHAASLASLQLENVNLSENLASLREEKVLFNKEKEFLVHENEKLLSSLADLRGMVEALQAENTNSNGILKAVEEEKKKLEEAKEYFVHENEKLAADLVKSSSLVEALRTDISKINGTLASLTEERNKLHEENQNLLSDNDSLLHELAETKVPMASQQAELTRAVAALQEASLRIEQLTLETVFLRINMEWHMAEMSRSVDISHQAEDSGHRNLINNGGSSLVPRSVESETALTMPEKISSESHVFGPLSAELPLGDSNDLSELEFWKRHMEEADQILQRLEKAIEELYSQLASSNTPRGKAVSSGVSKLIQAFESKSHTDDHETAGLSDNLDTEDPYMLTKTYMEHLKVFLNKLFHHAENTSKLIEGERQSRVFAEVKVAALMDCYESLKTDSDHLEGKNIELMVLLEVLRQHICISETRLREVVLLYETSHKQGYSLDLENSQLKEKLNSFRAKVTEFQSQLVGICQYSDKMFSSLSNSMETLYKEAYEKGSILKGEWNSSVEQIVQAVGKLDESIENFCSFTSSTGLNNSFEVGAQIVASIDAAIGVLQAQLGHFKVTERDREGILSMYMELNEEFNNVQEKNEMAIGILDKIYGSLRKLVPGSCGYAEGNKTGLVNEKLIDPLDFEVFDVLLQQLENIVEEEMQLKSVNNKLNSDLMGQVRVIDELNRRCLDADTVLKFFKDAEQAFKLDSLSTHTDEPLSLLKSLINDLIQKYNEAQEQVSLSMKNFASNEMHCRGLQTEVNHLSFLHIQLEVENFVLKDSWKMVNKDLLAFRMELMEKVAELEQSEQRVSTLREKLSIAVTKGKGLVMQRDSLKQSLAETSSQLEKYLQELQSKYVTIHELEAKLRNYSEAGERMEALESELSYIRNSATALRESFLLKDSVLQRIEEILEDLELPEQFHTGGIIEKVDWLAKIVNETTAPPPEWDQKNSVAAGSYSESGFAAEGWKEGSQPDQNSVDEFRRRYDELQNKFFALAEQNEMLEQSLMERNNLVQRWEDVLSRVDMPLQLRSSDPEDGIKWLGTSLSDAEDRCNYLQKTIDYLDTRCGSLSRDLKESENRILELESSFQSAVMEKELILTNLEVVKHQHDEASKKLAEWESRNEDFLKEICSLQEKLDQKLADEEQLCHFEVVVRQLQELIRDVLQDSGVDDLDFGSDGIKTLEQLLKTLIQKYTALSLGNPVKLDATDVSIKEEVWEYDEDTQDTINDSRNTQEDNVLALSKKLEDTLEELMHLEEERDRYKEHNQSLVGEIEAFGIKNNELQQLLNQEESKSASLREKLNIAVKKGKSLVQQRDSMKQVIDEVNTEVKHLKYEISLRENAIAEYEQKIRNFSINQERIEATESECGVLRDRLAETEQRLREKENWLSVMYNSLKDIDLDVDFSLGSSLENTESFRTWCHALASALNSAQQESRESKRAAGLLLAELNEVQERNDGLLEEGAKVAAELLQISREKELSEAAKAEALAQLEKLSALRLEERDHHLAEVTMLRSNVELLRDDLAFVDNLVADVLSKGLEILHNLEASVKSCMGPTKPPEIASLLAAGAPGGIICPKSENKIFGAEIGSLKERLCRHYTVLYEEANHMSEVVNAICRELTSLKQDSGARERDLMQLHNMVKEKDSQLFIMRRNISLLYEACTVSIMEIENWKAHQTGNGLATESQGVSFQHAYTDAANTSSGETYLWLEASSSENDVRTVREKLLSIVKDLINMQNEVVEDSQKEMKSIIMNLQKELHENDIQRDKISVEFVNKIKEAEAVAKSYFQDLQSAKSVVDHLKSQTIVMQEEHIALESRVKELEFRETTFIELEQRVASLTDALAAKEQETEALLQALDEEEYQMEEMSNKIGELEKSLRQKSKDLENLEASHGKVVKKLSITVSKFDELHQLSESLLSEVEKLQSQLQERDGEISFLRQEVTRCTSEALTATQMSNNSDEVHELLTWLDMMVARVWVHDMHFDDTDINQVHEHKQLLQKQVTSIISELEELRLAAQNADSLLQLERGKLEELTRKEEFLENSLREKESQLTLFKRVADSGQATSTTSEIVEVEPGINKRAASGTIATQVRSGRKMNNDQVAIAIDMDPSNAIEDEDDDKAHGFKSLTSSRIIPRFTRPVTDTIDGLWVSCDRALMRQPALRLGVIIYWAILHALLATFVV